MNSMTSPLDLETKVQAAEKAFGLFIRTIAALRHPQTGCPWDLQQDHKSLRRFMLEEAYEAAEAMLQQDDQHLLEELGDVLLQVVLNAQIAEDRRAGHIVDVIEGINSKMLRRHPHVFAPAQEGEIGAAEVKQNWEAIKAEERKVKEEKKAISSESGNMAEVETFAEARKIYPALTQAFKIGKKARSIDFDWDHPIEVLHQLRSELEELEAEIKAKAVGDEGAEERLGDELGDVFFSLAQLSRHLGFEPEEAALRGNHKFLRRFAAVERLALKRGLAIGSLARPDLEKLWLEAKIQM